MKKLLFCTQSYITGGGGVASYAHDFVDAFRDQYNISVVTSDNYKGASDKQTLIYHINGNDLSVENAHTFLKLLEEIKPDILVNSAYALVAMLNPYISNGIKVINISHFVNGKLSWYAGFNANYADSVISLSSYGKAYLEQKFNIKDKEKTKVVFNFMPEIKAQYETKQQRKVLNIVYPGGCSYAKSAEVVCLALKHLLRTPLEFHFYWLGNTKIAGGDNTKLKIRHIEDCLPKDRRIVHIGPVPRDESKKILADANIFLLPSRGEGFPITLIEAMRSGCIAIVSDAHHGSLDAIKNGKNGLIVKQGSAKEIVEKISAIIQHPVKYQDLYRASYIYYKEHLTLNVWKKNMQQILYATVSHENRNENFNELTFKRDCKKLNKMIRDYWFMDRIHQLYHFITFRIIKILR